MAKSNPMLRKLEAQMEAKYAILFHTKMDILLQIGEDAVIIAAHDALGMGKGRAVNFTATYRETINAIARLTMDDGEFDKELTYTKAKLDERLRAIVGDEAFADWDTRYKNKTPDGR